MSEPLTKEYFEEQIDLVMTTVKEGFDSVDQRFEAVDHRFDAVDRKFDAIDQRLTTLENDQAHIKERLTYIESGAHALTANIITKQYLDVKFDQLLAL